MNGTFLQRLDRFFTDGFRTLLGNVTGDQTPQTYVNRGIQPVVLVGRNVTSDTQTFDPIIDTTGRVLVNAGPTGAAPAAVTVLLDSGNVAGNVPIAAATTMASGVYEFLYFIYVYLADGVANTRTTGAPTVLHLFDSGSPLPNGPNAGGEWVGPTMSLTATQSGMITLSTGGVETKNQQGTMSVVTALKLQLPQTILHSLGVNNQLTASAAAATLGDAGDQHRFMLIGRRIS